MKKRFAACALIIMMFIGTGLSGKNTAVAAEDGLKAWPTGPDISGDGAIVVEATTGTVLYAKNIYDQFYPASTTKILTTLVALENSTPDEIVTVSYAADNYVSKTSSRMGLVEGEQITMEQGLYGIMLESANEATVAVGEHVGGSIARFIKMMNKKAADLGCERSHFANSHGLHNDDHYTCPYDLSLIARAAYQNEEFMKITGTATYAMPATNKNEAKTLINHHWFLNKKMKYDFCIGGKTGATTQAGYALVTYAKKDGMTLIAVVMHSPTWEDVYKDTKTLLDYVFDNFKMYKMSDLGAAQSEFPSMFNEIEAFDENKTPLIKNSEGGIVILPDEIEIEDTTKTVSYANIDEIEHGDNIIGTIEYRYGDRVVGTAEIVYYNPDNPMTAARFEAEWPSYMIPVDVAVQNVSTVENKVSTSGTVNRVLIVSIIIGIAAAAFTALMGTLIIILIRKKRRY